LRRDGGIGLLGGTFNPVHLAHLRLAEVSLETLGLERVAFVPARIPALKRTDDVIDPAHRVAMVRRAIEGRPEFDLLDLELHRSGPSYTVDTLRALQEGGEQRPLWFLLGSDAAAQLDQWREPEEILTRTNLAVVTRAGAPIEGPADCLPPALAKQFAAEPAACGSFVHRTGRQLRVLVLESLQISSTAIRERIREGRSIRYLVPEPVLAYIHEQGLYREDS
jgi:nicotinate-nucleotide adenylyltransferase